VLRLVLAPWKIDKICWSFVSEIQNDRATSPYRSISGLELP
jgi:hypothetical protein